MSGTEGQDLERDFGEPMRGIVKREVAHRTGAEAASNRRAELEKSIRDRLPPELEEPEGGWKVIPPDDLGDIRLGIDFGWTKSLHDRLLAIALAAGPGRKLGAAEMAEILMSRGQASRKRTSVINQVRTALADKPELYERTGVRTFRYRWH